MCCWIALSLTVLVRIAWLTSMQGSPRWRWTCWVHLCEHQAIHHITRLLQGWVSGCPQPCWRHTRSPAFPCTRKASLEMWVGVQLWQTAPSVGFAPRSKEPCWCSAPMHKWFAHGYSTHQELHRRPASQSNTPYSTLKAFIFLYEFKVYYLPTWHTWALSILLWVSALYLALLARVLAKFRP